MKQFQILIYIGLLLGLNSCRSFRQLTAKDHTTASVSNKKLKSQKEPQFIEGIEVTPGSTMSSKHKTSTANTKKTNTSKPNNPVSGGIFSTENASYLQLKFSVLMGVPVSQLENIALLEQMDKWWGTKYCMGGTTENCLDCSAFTQILYRDLYALHLPRTAQEQYQAADIIGIDDLQEGDLVFFHTSGRSRRSITHVGVYLQNSKFVHAATSGGVMISDLKETYWSPKFRGGGRMKQHP